MKPKEREIRDLEERIRGLKRDAEFKVKEARIEVERAVIREQENRLKLEKSMSALSAKNEILNKQINETGPYTQLTEILKALTVKIPTFDIKGLTVTTKGK